MLWTRGLFRLWLVASLAWVSYGVYQDRVEKDLKTYLGVRGAAGWSEKLITCYKPDKRTQRKCRPGEAKEILAGLQNQERESSATLEAFARRVIYPVAGGFVLVFLLSWVMRGFTVARYPDLK